MFFHTLFKQQKEEETREICAAEKLLILVRELLNKELPEHYAQHHILFTANYKLEILNGYLKQHRNQENHLQKIGQFHTEMYNGLRKTVSDLQCLVDGYMELSIDVNQMNHRLLFYYDQIHYIHENYALYMAGQFSNHSSDSFWQAAKEDVLDILRKIL